MFAGEPRGAWRRGCMWGEAWATLGALPPLPTSSRPFQCNSSFDFPIQNRTTQISLGQQQLPILLLGQTTQVCFTSEFPQLSAARFPPAKVP